MTTKHSGFARLTGRALKALALTALPAALLVQSAAAQNAAPAGGRGGSRSQRVFRHR